MWLKPWYATDNEKPKSPWQFGRETHENASSRGSIFIGEAGSHDSCIPLGVSWSDSASTHFVMETKSRLGPSSCRDHLVLRRLGYGNELFLISICCT